jgi:hypothetical protein
MIACIDCYLQQADKLSTSSRDQAGVFHPNNITRYDTSCDGLAPDEASGNAWGDLQQSQTRFAIRPRDRLIFPTGIRHVIWRRVERDNPSQPAFRVLAGGEIILFFFGSIIVYS